MRLGAVLLASGLSRRFGANKLLEPLCGRPMVCYALDAMRALDAVRWAVVTGDETVARLARERGMEVVRNDAPGLGQAHSIALGAGAMRDMDAVLLLAGDQPLLGGESLRMLVRRFSQSGRGIACLRDETHFGNPAMFSASYLPELMALSGDRGAKAILSTHENDLLIVPCIRECELADADTPQALARIADAMKRK